MATYPQIISQGFAHAFAQTYWLAKKWLECENIRPGHWLMTRYTRLKIDSK